jgi:hypothetical protein
MLKETIADAQREPFLPRETAAARELSQAEAAAAAASNPESILDMNPSDLRA